MIGELQAVSQAATYISYDNRNMKLYAYPKDEVVALHVLSEPMRFSGGAQVQICEACGEYARGAIISYYKGKPLPSLVLWERLFGMNGAA